MKDQVMVETPLHAEQLQQIVDAQQTAAIQQRPSPSSDAMDRALEVGDLALDVVTEPGLLSGMADGLSTLASGAADLAGSAVSGALETAGELLGGLLS